MYESMAKNFAPLLLSVAAIVLGALLAITVPTDPAPLPEDHGPPVAVAGPDVTVALGEEAVFDGMASTDDVGVVAWWWVFEYNGETIRLEGARVFFIFEEAGSYQFTLTVADAAGNLAGDTLTVTVLED